MASEKTKYPRILVVGAGAVGGYFGAHLVDAGRDVTFLVRPQRAAQLEAHGLTVHTPDGDLRVRARTVTAASLAAAAGTADADADADFGLILLSVKAFALERAIEDLSPAMGATARILPTLNGMRHLDLLRERFGDDRTLGGACVVAAQVEDSGDIRQLYGDASITYGSLGRREDPLLEGIDQALSDVGFTTRLSTHIELDMWEKWVLLASGGALTCLLRGSVGEIAAAPGGTTVARTIIAEAVEIATAAGFAPRSEFVDRVEQLLTEEDSAFTTSMYRDLVLGGEIEGDQIVGDLVRRGGSLGVAAPMLSAALAALVVYQTSRR